MLLVGRRVGDLNLLSPSAIARSLATDGALDKGFSADVFRVVSGEVGLSWLGADAELCID